MKKRVSALVCLVLALALLSGCFSAAAAPSSMLLTPPANGCVADLAGVLESDTVEHIVSQNQALTDSTGAAIVVVTVDFLNGMDIDDYATQLFNDWEIGDSREQNGLLILLVIGEDNYTILQGTGLQSALPTSTLGEYAYRYLEDDFVAGDYDAGVNKIFDAFYNWFLNYYAGQAGGQLAPGGTVYPSHARDDDDDTAYALIGFFGLLIGLVIVIIAVESVRQSVYSRRAFLYPGIVYRPFFIFRPRPPRPYIPRFSHPPRPPVQGNPGGFGGTFGGGHSRGGGFTRSSGSSHRSSGSFGGGFRSGGSHRSSFGGGGSRGGGFRRH